MTSKTVQAEGERARFPGVSAAILAGGGGTRMGGVNKALIKVEGTEIIRRTANLLAPLVGELFIVANDATPFAGLGPPVVPDLLPGCGALGGIHAAVCRAANPCVLCVACDMPFLSRPLLLLLLGAAREDLDAVIPRPAGGPEPLLALYGRSVLPAIEGALAAGKLKIMEALAGARVRYLEDADLERADPGLRSFCNVNTPGDLAAARARATGESA